MPAGGHYMTRKGEVETTLYRIIRMESACIVEDIYEVASVVLSDDSIYFQTLIGCLTVDIVAGGGKCDVYKGSSDLSLQL